MYRYEYKWKAFLIFIVIFITGAIAGYNLPTWTGIVFLAIFLTVSYFIAGKIYEIIKRKDKDSTLDD